jgi:hypothetical protein
MVQEKLLVAKMLPLITKLPKFMLQDVGKYAMSGEQYFANFDFDLFKDDPEEPE